MEFERTANAFKSLGEIFRKLGNDEDRGEMGMLLAESIVAASHYNQFFTPRNVKRMFCELGNALNDIELFLRPYKEAITNRNSSKTVALITAGNIPLAGFHDIMCTLLSGNNVLLRVSSDDPVLTKAACATLFLLEPALRERVHLADGKVSGMDAVIATGNNNSSRYFEFYFAKYPHIIRRNRNTVAVLTGDESTEDLRLLGKDIFTYFGLGCRSVSKLLVPKDYDFSKFFESIVSYGDELLSSKKYINNYDYHKAVYLLNSEKLFDNNFVLLKEDDRLGSPVGVIFYQRYQSKSELENILFMNSSDIQCVVGRDYIPFGQAQAPALHDYADKVDTMEFLTQL